MSVWHFARCFKLATGKTPLQHVTERRMERALALMANSSMKVTEIALEVGFPNPSHFSRSFKKHFGANPAAYLSTRARRHRMRNA
ncbi:helix-turn-helix transcriptional regulator [Aquabacterium sp. J223]|uniref:helix-turn-helix transcriptional regulator n=1 Tax=Aquabacterium sp. J223 TaxID=2898431 RepID=UPI003916E243